MADIFLSYSRADAEKAGQLAAVFAKCGWTVFWDRDVPPGSTWERVLEEQLEAARVVVVLWSEPALVSEWVNIEAAEGHAARKLIPVRIAAVQPPLQFRRIEAADLTLWIGGVEFRGLLDALGSRLGAADVPIERFEDERPIDTILGDLRSRASPPPDARADEPQHTTSRRVLIVDGREHPMREAVARTVSALGLEPVIVHGGSPRRRVIDAFEAEAADAAFAVVLLAVDDDEGEQHADGSAFLARQTTVFELGYFVSELGRGRVVALVTDTTSERPSDIAGVRYLDVDGSEDLGWRVALAQEMKAAGIDINLRLLDPKYRVAVMYLEDADEALATPATGVERGNILGEFSATVRSASEETKQALWEYASMRSGRAADMVTTILRNSGFRPDRPAG